MAELTREQLESLRAFHGGWSNPLIDLALKGLEAKKLTEQRDALLAALKVLVKAKEHDFHPIKVSGVEWFSASAAIAAVEGKHD